MEIWLSIFLLTWLGGNFFLALQNAIICVTLGSQHYFERSTATDEVRLLKQVHREIRMEFEIRIRMKSMHLL